MTKQEAYIELRQILDNANALMADARKVARENDLVLVQRHLDALPETLDPSRYVEVEVIPKPYKRYGTDKLIQPEPYMVKRFLDTDDEYPGENVENAWIPSQMC